MASTQDQTSAPQLALTNEENTLLEEVKKEANNVVSENKELQVVTYGAIGNATKRTLELKYIHIYSGHFGSSSPASVLEKGKVTRFDHEGSPPKGSKVALVYAGNGHQWILGWNVPLISTQMRNTVYVADMGESTEPVNWEEFEKVLDGTAITLPVIPNAYAHITQGSKAFLTALFCEPRITEGK